MKRWKLLLVAVVFGLFSSGCPSMSTLHTATPTPQGKFDLKFAASYLGLAIGGVDINAPAQPEVHGRIGISDNFGLGFKAYLGGLGVDGNIAAVNNESFAFSIDPALSFVKLPGVFYGITNINLLADVVKADGFTLTVGAKPGMTFATASNVGGGTQFGAGGTLGVTYMVSESFGLQGWFDSMYLFNNTVTSPFWYTGTVGVNLRL